ncbi:hypothetical protein MKW92_034283 [Papaver armeniacum]|nr:hypothetical protein MKW92_034283 [Papaver armeniacum]
MKGVRCKRSIRCITSVGIYEPRGTAVLPSTALMLAVPAQIAGCKIVILATPRKRRKHLQGYYLSIEVLYCAKKAGVTHVLKPGGAIDCGLGTLSCPKVENFFGTGNQYITVLVRAILCRPVNINRTKTKKELEYKI